MAELSRGDVVEIAGRPALVWQMDGDVLALLPIVPATAKPDAQDVRLADTPHAERCRLFPWPFQSQPVVGRVDREILARIETALQLGEPTTRVTAELDAITTPSRPATQEPWPQRPFRVRHPHRYHGQIRRRTA